MFCYLNKSGVTFDTIGGYIQLEYGSTATSYQPYTSTTKTLNLGDIELSKIGNYQDYIYEDEGKWYKKGYVGKIAHKTNWVANNMASNNRSVFTLGTNNLPNAINIYGSINCISNTFIAMTQGTQGSTTDINNICINGNNMYIKFADTINTKELAKAQLDSMTNFVAYYILADTTDTEITNETLLNQLNELKKLQSIEGTTILYSNGNLPIIFEAKALKGE